MTEVSYKELEMILKIMDNDETIGIVKRMDNSVFKARITKNKDMYDACIEIKSPEGDYAYNFSLSTVLECIYTIRFTLDIFKDK